MCFTLLCYCTVFHANDIFYDITNTTSDLNIPYLINQESHISPNSNSRKKIQYVFAYYFDNFK